MPLIVALQKTLVKFRNSRLSNAAKERPQNDLSTAVMYAMLYCYNQRKPLYSKICIGTR